MRNYSCPSSKQISDTKSKVLKVFANRRNCGHRSTSTCRLLNGALTHKLRSQSELIWINGVFAKRLTREQMCRPRARISLYVCLRNEWLPNIIYLLSVNTRVLAHLHVMLMSNLRCTPLYGSVWFQITGQMVSLFACVQFLSLLSVCLTDWCESRRSLCPNPAAPLTLGPLWITSPFAFTAKHLGCRVR